MTGAGEEGVVRTLYLPSSSRKQHGPELQFHSHSLLFRGSDAGAEAGPRAVLLWLRAPSRPAAQRGAPAAGPAFGILSPFYSRPGGCQVRRGRQWSWQSSVVNGCAKRDFSAAILHIGKILQDRAAIQSDPADRCGKLSAAERESSFNVRDGFAIK